MSRNAQQCRALEIIITEINQLLDLDMHQLLQQPHLNPLNANIPHGVHGPHVVNLAERQQ